MAATMAVTVATGSAALPSENLFKIISGAKYSGVPQRVYVLPSTILANPKSVSLI